MHFRTHALLTTLLPTLFAVVAQGSPIHKSAKNPCVSELKNLDGSHQRDHHCSDKGSTLSCVEKLEIELKYEEVICLYTSDAESNDDDRVPKELQESPHREYQQCSSPTENQMRDQNLQGENEKEQPEMKARDLARRTAVARASPEQDREQHEGGRSEGDKDAVSTEMPTGQVYAIAFRGGHVMWTFIGSYTNQQQTSDRVNDFMRYLNEHGAISHEFMSEVVKFSRDQGTYKLGFISAPDTGALGTNSNLIINSAGGYLHSHWKYDIKVGPTESEMRNLGTGREQANRRQVSGDVSGNDGDVEDYDSTSDEENSDAGESDEEESDEEGGGVALDEEESDSEEGDEQELDSEETGEKNFNKELDEDGSDEEIEEWDSDDWESDEDESDEDENDEDENDEDERKR